MTEEQQKTAEGAVPPFATLDNGILKATLALPDADTTYYRAVRFEAALVTGVEYKSHRYFAEFNDPRDNRIHDSLSGTADEFNTPLGYAEAEPGDEFIKIGVGLLERLSSKPCSSFDAYPVRKRAAYKILARGADFLTLQSEATCRHGYGYRMEKHFALQDNKLVIRYVMTNIGEKPLRSRQYCHNFTLIDDVPAAPGAYTTTFPFAICPASEGNGRGQWKNGTVTTSGEVVFMPFANENLTVSDNFAEVRQTSTGLGMRCTGDFVPEKVVYFSTARTVCPEIFKALNIAPGQSDAWTRTIEFF